MSHPIFKANGVAHGASDDLDFIYIDVAEEKFYDSSSIHVQ